MTLAAPRGVSATPESVSNDESYKESIMLLKKYGHESLIKNMVKMQRDQMEKYGNSLDDYTNVIGILGSEYGTTQTNDNNKIR